MRHGFTLIETLVTVLIIIVLVAVALPYYRNAVESSRMTEVVMLWGRQKNWATGYNMSADQAQKSTDRLNKAGLNHFTGKVVCREKADPNELCWEAEFTRLENSSVHYKLLTAKNFTRMMCMGLNGAGEDFCESQSQQDTPETIDGKKAYWIR
ncbi:type IV pilin protein [Candidatus Avelusimicrobium luingense]|uniref:type IV pilin protein n=1 Tax=Candidatus Avelusimicrobium luingense TaxID=3416211 RepID=UPI003D139FC3